MPLNRASAERLGPWIVATLIIAGVTAVYVTHIFAWGALIVFGGMAIGAWGVSGSKSLAAVFAVPAILSLIALLVFE